MGIFCGPQVSRETVNIFIGHYLIRIEVNFIVKIIFKFQYLCKKKFYCFRAIQRTIHRKESYSAMNNLRSASNDSRIDFPEKKNTRKHGKVPLDFFKKICVCMLLCVIHF